MEYTPVPSGDPFSTAGGLEVEIEPTRTKRATPLPKLAILASAGIRSSEVLSLHASKRVSCSLTFDAAFLILCDLPVCFSVRFED